MTDLWVWFISFASFKLKICDVLAPIQFGSSLNAQKPEEDHLLCIVFIKRTVENA